MIINLIKCGIVKELWFGKYERIYRIGFGVLIPTFFHSDLSSVDGDGTTVAVSIRLQFKYMFVSSQQPPLSHMLTESRLELPNQQCIWLTAPHPLLLPLLLLLSGRASHVQTHKMTIRFQSYFECVCVYHEYMYIFISVGIYCTAAQHEEEEGFWVARNRGYHIISVDWIECCFRSNREGSKWNGNYNSAPAHIRVNIYLFTTSFTAFHPQLRWSQSKWSVSIFIFWYLFPIHPSALQSIPSLP